MTREQALARQEAARKAFQAADDAWAAELQRLFGSVEAGEVRYTSQAKGIPGTKLYELHYARDQARVAWHEAVDFAREFSDER